MATFAKQWRPEVWDEMESGESQVLIPVVTWKEVDRRNYYGAIDKKTVDEALDKIPHPSDANEQSAKTSRWPYHCLFADCKSVHRQRSNLSRHLREVHHLDEQITSFYMQMIIANTDKYRCSLSRLGKCKNCESKGQIMGME